MDFRSIDNRRVQSIRRFRELRGVSTIGAFRGAIEPSFSNWIGSHWRFLEARLFKPVSLTFRQAGNPFGQISWPQSREPGSQFFFSPRIQLALNVGPINRVVVENNTHDSQVLPLSAAARGELWSGVLRSRDQPDRAIRPPGSRILPNRERLFSALTGILQARRATDTSRGTAAPALITISTAVQRWTQFLISSLRHTAPQAYQSKKAREVGSLLTRKVLAGLAETALQQGATLSLRTTLKTMRTDGLRSSRESIVTQLNLSEFRSRLASQEHSFTNVVQTLATGKATGPEVTARQIQYFGLSPDLSYAKADNSQLQGVVNALRDFRPSQSDAKTAVSQLPSMAQLTSQVRQELERELRIERERRGL